MGPNLQGAGLTDLITKGGMLIIVGKYFLTLFIIKQKMVIRFLGARIPFNFMWTVFILMSGH